MLPNVVKVLWNVEKGVKVAVISACGLAAWTGLVRLVGGEGAFARHGVTYPQMVVVYLVGGAAAGALGESLAPLARWRLGGVLVGGPVGGAAVGFLAAAVALRLRYAAPRRALAPPAA